MKVAIVTDAWTPQVNGVVTTLKKTGETLAAMGYGVRFFTPEPFKTAPLPTYPSIRIAINPARKTRAMLKAYAPDAVHIATEGPVGLAARRFCIKTGRAFTTSYHTRFPEYLRLRLPVPLAASCAYLRWFHGAAACTMVATASFRAALASWRFRNLALWPRGVDTAVFKPYPKDYLSGPRPITLYAGRVAVEKNIEAYLALELPGTKYVVGDGPDLAMLRRRYPEVRFVGYKFGEDLARHLSAADVFVFPSHTDTFGVVMLEAMACGVPVAAFPVPGPQDVVRPGVTGILDADLRTAIIEALALDGAQAQAYAKEHSWTAATTQFAHNLAWLKG